jgi:hypothetical protein
VCEGRAPVGGPGPEEKAVDYVQRLARERDTCRRIFEKRCLSDLEFELLMLWDDAVRAWGKVVSGRWSVVS